MGFDHPRATRHQKRFAARFGQLNLLHEGQTLNLSERGIALRAQDVFPPGTHLRIAVKPTDRAAFALEGVVVWAQTGNEAAFFGIMGIRLTAVDERYTLFVKTATDSGAWRRTAGVPSIPPSRPPSSLPPGVNGPPSLPPQFRQGSWPTSGSSIPPAYPSPPPQAAAPPPIPQAPGTIPPATIPPSRVPSVPDPPSIPPLAAVSFEAFLHAGQPIGASDSGGMTVVRRAPSSGVVPVGPGGNKPLRMPRFQAELPIRWGTRELDQDGATINLSRTGVSFTIQTTLAPGARVKFAIPMHEGTPARGAGVAVWQRAAGDLPNLQIGIRILHADNRYYELLDHLARQK